MDDIWLYIASESGSEEIADHLIDSITDRFVLLSSHPLVGRRRDDLRTGLYTIIYRIEDATVLILHVIHSHRDIQAILGQ